MTVPAGTYTKYAAKGLREDLTDMIYNISPTSHPFMTNIGRDGVATSVYHEWQTDSLAAATSGNAHVEGDDDTVNTASATTRLGNYCQIMKKVPGVSGTLDAVKKAGRSSELAYQIGKRSAELKNDVEKALCGTQVAAVGTAAGARSLAGVGRWLWTNQTKMGAAATTPAVSSGAPTVALTAGTAGTFVEANLKSAVSDIWTQGGEPNLVLTGIFNKTAASAFAGIATKYQDLAGKKPSGAMILGAADVYASEAGILHIVASHFSPSNNVYVLDTQYWQVAYLRRFRMKDLAVTGDNMKKELLCELTLEARNQAASGKIYTTTTS